MNLRSACYMISGFAFAAAPAQAIVIRHDVPDAEYRVDRREFLALVDLPGEGHGVLIADRWVITAAHAVFGRTIASVIIGGIPRSVAKVIVHPGYKVAPKALLSGDAGPLIAFLSGVDDIALIELSEPVRDVLPAPLYRRTDEQGRVAEVLGRGVTGTGAVGQYANAPHRGELRRAYQRVISADGGWLVFRFDAPPNALPLAGLPSDGDSGGPILIESGGVSRLAGLVSHKIAAGDLAAFRPGVYGSITYQTRISHYADWIDGVIAGDRPAAS